MNDNEYDAWLAERGWRRIGESANGKTWQACADNGWDGTRSLGEINPPYADARATGYGATLIEARADVRRLVEEREAQRGPRT